MRAASLGKRFRRMRFRSSSSSGAVVEGLHSSRVVPRCRRSRGGQRRGSIQSLQRHTMSGIVSTALGWRSSSSCSSRVHRRLAAGGHHRHRHRHRRRRHCHSGIPIQQVCHGLVLGESTIAGRMQTTTSLRRVPRRMRRGIRCVCVPAAVGRGILPRIALRGGDLRENASCAASVDTRLATVG